jgi:lipopolysaccharide/colanic/teichoic acid biosynthesis glycosyltransferase
MIKWFKKRVSSNWNRRTRWSPLLQNQRELQRSISKERSRVDRNGGLFGFIILSLREMNGAQRQIKQLAKILHKRLRDTDEKGHLGPGRIGIILPETNSAGTTLVLEQLIQLAHSKRLSIYGEAFVYPDQPLGGKGQHSDSSHSNDSVEVAPIPVAIMAAEYPVWKRATDIAGASIGLLLGSPILILCAFLVKLTSRGPILFCQQRTGYLGNEFTIYKFRSMIVGAALLQSELQERNERDGPAFKISDDPRTTLAGRFLRATGLDELPQLINVFKGDMALVGPRPLPVSEAAQCEPWQRVRLEAKPGLTCFWQISKSRKVTFAQWMRMDILYVRNMSVMVDLKLILKTVGAVFLGRVGH